MTALPEGSTTRLPARVGLNIDRVLGIGFLLSIVIVAFIAGSILTTAEVFPTKAISDAYKGAQALYTQQTAYSDVYNTDLWYPERTKQGGVITNVPGLVQPGVTLFTTGEAAAAYLVDENGKVLHKWHKPFSEVWTPASGIERPQPDSHVYFRKAMLLPNGDLIADYEGNGDTPYGYALVKLDKDSNVIWTYFGRTHHDFDIGPDGRIYALVHGFVDKPDSYFQNLATPRLLDSLVVLSPDGKEEQRISLFDAIASSRWQQLIHTVSFYAVADPLHANDVDFITDEMARNFSYGKAGQVLVSFRELGAIGVLDLPTRTLVWGARGSWLGQHDPDILPNGNILMFDNYGGFRRQYAQRTSRIIEVDPSNDQIVWRYAGTQENPLGSLIRGGQERLQNGNTLITESSGGRILEVTPDGQIVWQFINPVRGGHPEQKPKIPIICQAQRLDPAKIDPAVLVPSGAVGAHFGQSET